MLTESALSNPRCSGILSDQSCLYWCTCVCMYVYYVCT